MNDSVRREALAAEAAPAATELTAREQAVFTLLRAHPGRLYTRADILERVWGLDFSGDERVVDAYVNRIRRKLEGGGGPRIETVRGAGYRCVLPENPERPAWPDLPQWPVGARRLLELVSAAGDRPDDLLQGLLDSLDSVPGLDSLTLLRLSPHASPEVLAAAGSPPPRWPPLPAPGAAGGTGSGPLSGLITLPTASGTTPGTMSGIVSSVDAPVLLLPVPTAAEPGLTLAFTGQPGAEWDADVQASLRGAAAPVAGALHRALEVRAGQQALGQLREQVRVLEDRAVKARQDSAALLGLTHLLEDARSVPDILNVSLPVLAELAGTDACAAWFTHAGGPASAALHRTGLPVTPPARHVSDPAHPGDLTVEIGDQTLSLRPVGTRTQAASPLLPVAARCAALALTQATLLRALERTALTDEYTGLGNRQAFLADLHAEVAFAARHGAQFAVTLVDLGNIRYLNATSGYAGGNDLISRLARTLRTVTRIEDRAYRLNGATFALLLRLPQEPGGAVRGWQDRLGAALTQLKQAAPVPLDLQTSLVVCPQDAASTSELLRQALEELGPVQPPAPPLPGTADHPLSSPQDRRRPHDG
ncbi:winged helix-turn-helix domain-containing protein [Deinococcus sp.]|uniref:winged helix-turn-helix domain-containing protein n=1 Tax=Deinococcus sp. TaxID=47478 RepID=UPI00391AF20D